MIFLAFKKRVEQKEEQDFKVLVAVLFRPCDFDRSLTLWSSVH